MSKHLNEFLAYFLARAYIENVQADSYKLLGSESRRFYVIHVYDRRFDDEKGYSVSYSRGQLTTSLYSDTLKASVCRPGNLSMNQQANWMTKLSQTDRIATEKKKKYMYVCILLSNPFID